MGDAPAAAARWHRAPLRRSTLAATAVLVCGARRLGRPARDLAAAGLSHQDGPPLRPHQPADVRGHCRLLSLVATRRVDAALGFGIPRRDGSSRLAASHHAAVHAAAVRVLRHMRVARHATSNSRRERLVWSSPPGSPRHRHRDSTGCRPAASACQRLEPVLGEGGHALDNGGEHLSHPAHAFRNQPACVALWPRAARRPGRLSPVAARSSLGQVSRHRHARRRDRDCGGAAAMDPPSGRICPLPAAGTAVPAARARRRLPSLCRAPAVACAPALRRGRAGSVAVVGRPDAGLSLQSEPVHGSSALSVRLRPSAQSLCTGGAARADPGVLSPACADAPAHADANRGAVAPRVEFQSAAVVPGSPSAVRQDRARNPGLRGTRIRRVSSDGDGTAVQRICPFERDSRRRHAMAPTTWSCT